MVSSHFFTEIACSVEVVPVKLKDDEKESNKTGQM